jgi:hypothetical protein
VATNAVAVTGPNAGHRGDMAEDPIGRDDPLELRIQSRDLCIEGTEERDQRGDHRQERGASVPPPA